MKFTLIIASLATFISYYAAAGVIGKVTGFATGTTGVISATPAIPKDIAQLTTWLTDSVARVIVLDKEYNFIGSEGTASESGCRPASNKCLGAGRQDAINHTSCANGNASAGVKIITIKYNKAGVAGINIGSNESLIGIGSKGVIRGKDLRIANGANIIIQNIHITELNPQYI